MIHKIKINKAQSRAGFLPMATQEIKATIDKYPALYDKLTSDQLSLVMRALDHHWHKAVEWAGREALVDTLLCVDGVCYDLVPIKDDDSEG